MWVFEGCDAFPESFRVVNCAGERVPNFPSPAVKYARAGMGFSVVVPCHDYPHPVRVGVTALRVVFQVLVVAVRDVSYRFPICRVFQCDGETSQCVIRANERRVGLVVGPSRVQVKPISPRSEIHGYSVLVVQVPGDYLDRNTIRSYAARRSWGG